MGVILRESGICGVRSRVNGVAFGLLIGGSIFVCVSEQRLIVQAGQIFAFASGRDFGFFEVCVCSRLRNPKSVYQNIIYALANCDGQISGKCSRLCVPQAGISALCLGLGMAIPPKPARHVVAFHSPVSRHNILNSAGQQMPIVRQPLNKAGILFPQL